MEKVIRSPNPWGQLSGARPIGQAPDPMGRYLQSHKTCTRCGAPATHVDHMIPHGGDECLMFDKNNWRASCHACHSLRTPVPESKPSLPNLSVADWMADRGRVLPAESVRGVAAAQDFTLCKHF